MAETLSGEGQGPTSTSKKPYHTPGHRLYHLRDTPHVDGLHALLESGVPEEQALALIRSLRDTTEEGTKTYTLALQSAKESARLYAHENAREVPSWAREDAGGDGGENEDEDEQEEEEEEHEEHEDEVEVEGHEEEDEELPAEPSSDDLRTEEELDAIRYEILELEAEVQIGKRYRIVDRLGEGTFSSVYKAIDCAHPFYNNTQWKGKSGAKHLAPFLPSLSRKSSSSSSVNLNSSSSTSSTHRRRRSSSSYRDSPYSALLAARKQLKGRAAQMSAEKEEGGNPVYVALKRIYVTSSPIRIHNELEILADLRSARHTSYLISAIRHEDQVIAVMPYERHQDFRTYYRNMSLETMRHYLRCLFAALADCHSLGIMHRDIKPANFLFNILTNTGKVCDFGLAQRLSPGDWHGHCLHTMPQLWKGADREGAIHGQRIKSPVDTMTQIQIAWTEYAHKYGYDELSEIPPPEDDPELVLPRDINGHILTPWRPSAQESMMLEHRIYKEEFEDRWQPVMRLPAGQRVGYQKPEMDKRPSIRANRAGTRGFRAPEVVLKCPDQTMALDIWSVGVTLLCILTRRFPFFASNDDTEALLEIATIFGKGKMERCGALHNRTFITNIPTIENPKYSSLHELVQSLNPNIFIESMPVETMKEYRLKYGSNFIDDESLIRQLDHTSWYNANTQPDLFQAIDLLRRCLMLDCTKRIAAHDALRHPFLAGKEAAV